MDVCFWFLNCCQLPASPCQDKLNIILKQHSCFSEFYNQFRIEGHQIASSDAIIKSQSWPLESKLCWYFTTSASMKVWRGWNSVSKSHEYLNGLWLTASRDLHGGWEDGKLFWNLRNNNPVYIKLKALERLLSSALIKLGYWKILSEWWAGLTNLPRITSEEQSDLMSDIPFTSLLSRYAPQVVIWRGFAGRLVIPKGFFNTPALYRQDYYITASLI